MIAYPATLPMPQTSVVSPAERRRLSDPSRPREAVPAERDRRKLEQIAFPPMTAEQFAAFRAWWRDDLTLGGAWFAADWPLPQGIVTAVRRFVGTPRWSFVAGGFWRITALCEVRGLSLLPEQGGGGSGIAWYAPINDPFGGSLDHGNSGTGSASSFGGGSVTQLYAGLAGWSGETIVWSIAGWDSPDDHAAPEIIDAVDGWALVRWNNDWGWDPDFPYLGSASIGSLVLTATINGEPVPVGQRLIAVTTPNDGDYPSIAWGPEP